MNSGIKGPREMSTCSLERFLNSKIVLVMHTFTRMLSKSTSVCLLCSQGSQGQRRGANAGGRMLSSTLCGFESYEETTKDAAAYTLNFVHFSSGG